MFHSKEEEAVPAWCRSVNFVPGKIQLVQAKLSLSEYPVVKTLDVKSVFFLTDILGDTITPYNVSTFTFNTAINIPVHPDRSYRRHIFLQRTTLTHTQLLLTCTVD